jgi:hypothetical protein
MSTTFSEYFYDKEKIFFKIVFGDNAPSHPSNVSDFCENSTLGFLLQHHIASPTKESEGYSKLKSLLPASDLLQDHQGI